MLIHTHLENQKLVAYYCAHTVYLCPKGRLVSLKRGVASPHPPWIYLIFLNCWHGINFQNYHLEYEPCHGMPWSNCWKSGSAEWYRSSWRCLRRDYNMFGKHRGEPRPVGMYWSPINSWGLRYFFYHKEGKWDRESRIVVANFCRCNEKKKKTPVYIYSSM